MILQSIEVRIRFETIECDRDKTADKMQNMLCAMPMFIRLEKRSKAQSIA